MNSRRSFLKYSTKTLASAGIAGALGRLSTLNAYASGGAGYKALVGVFLIGGNDGADTLIPISTAKQKYQSYASIRGPMALLESQLCPIGVASDVYGLHPKLREMQALFGTGKVAFLANVGNLVEPTTRSQILSKAARLPDSMFSHSNQMNQWQAASPSDLTATGWGGRAADLLSSVGSLSSFPMAVVTGATGIFPVGTQTKPATVVPNAALGLHGGSATRDQAFQQLLQFDNGIKLMQVLNGVTTRGINDSSLLSRCLASAPPLRTIFPTSALGAQLKQIAQIISVRGALGVSRQIFFVSVEGFDTHSNHLENRDSLMQDLSMSLNAFYQATIELAVPDSVTTFTNSEFGRTLQPSANNGTDHAWGSHAMIVGGAVKGGALYGTFPTLALAGPDDADTRGVIIPTTSVEQYGATLAKWFGVPPASIPSVFPSIANFTSPDLGFMS